MTKEVYQLQKDNIIAGRQLDLIDAKEAVRRLVKLENERARQTIEEAKLITLNREGER